MQAELHILLQAQYPLIYLVTAEENRAEGTIAQILRELPGQGPGNQTLSLQRWTVTHGLVAHGTAKTKIEARTLSPEAALAAVVQNPEPGVYLFKDLHPFLKPGVVRWLRDAIALGGTQQKTIILMSPVLALPPELEKDTVVLDFGLPTLPELRQVLDRHLLRHRQPPLGEPVKEKLLKAALGLTKDEAEKVYLKAQITAGQLTADEVEIILSEKKQLIRRNGILEFMEEDETLAAVGGLDELKKWLHQRANAFTEKARAYGLPQPKGMLILGVPGCGKSLIAKTTAKLWGLPLLRLDLGRVYDGSTVGRSEANLRSALKTAESIAPTILFIDELDKAFAGGTGSGDADGGTSSRIFGSFLTWLQEKTSPVFVVATANRIDRLPGEFLRKGRFDEIFFVDLPVLAERQAIFQIHLQKRRPQGDRFDLLQLAQAADGFSGAEIEQALIAAMYEGFAQDREFTQEDILVALQKTQPLSRTMTEQVGALRDWARQRARPASTAGATYQQLEF